MSKKYNIKWTEADSKELARSVKNFNAKISRLEKKNPALKNILPERVKVKEMKELIDTRQDLKRELNSLNRFTQRGAEQLVEVPDNDYNLMVTKWQKEDMTMRRGIVNRTRKQRKQMVEGLERTHRGKKQGYTIGQVGMGKADEVALEPINAFTPKMTRTSLKKKHAVLKQESRSLYWSEREQLLKDNYITSLNNNFSQTDIADIVDEINNMDFKDFYKKFLEEEEGKFENHYHKTKEEEQAQVNYLRSVWIPNKKGA